MSPTQAIFWVPAERRQLLHDIGLVELEQVFSDPRIKPWRRIRERENCVLDAARPNGEVVRLHIKRHKRKLAGGMTPAEQEVQGIFMLERAGIATVPLVAWGRLADGRSFLISEDLTGFEPADKAIEHGLAFERILEPTADLAATLHNKRLHHRDLYLCHFFVRINESVELHLIDPGRVNRLPPWPFTRRWIIKDVAQFVYSATQNAVAANLIEQWLDRYCQQRQIRPADIATAIQRKVRHIARHDARLKRKRPERDVSLES